MINQGDSQPAAASWFAYPGMAYAKALALRMEEEKSKSQDHTESDQALREAITDFPQVVVPLADKIGASLPEGIRSEVLFSVEAGYRYVLKCMVLPSYANYFPASPHPTRSSFCHTSMCLALRHCGRTPIVCSGLRTKSPTRYLNCIQNPPKLHETMS